MELYWISGSAPAWRGMLVLELKAIEYTSRILETATKEQTSEAFRAINPRGQVPVLVDHDLVLCESRAIVLYLERHTPTPALLGATSVDTGRIAAGYESIINHVDTTVTQFVRPVFRDKLESERDSVRQHAGVLRREFDLLEDQLQGRRWLMGDQVTLADVALIPAMQRFSRALGKSDEVAGLCGFEGFEQQFPALWRWNTATEALPEFDRTFPPHWR